MAAGFVDDEDPEGVSVVSVWVDPTARERGVGIALVDAVLDWARARGANRADLWVTDTNAAAIALYRRCGFCPTGQSQPLPHTPGIQEIQMARDLRPLDASRGS
jgi:ribosomal protein S18 acetylase RimI-like enzyme